MSKDLVEDAVGVPGCAAADEFAIGCSESVENGVVEVLIISYEIKLIRVDDVKRWASDSFGVVWESLNATTVNEKELRFLRL
jgi:hypothetical protein